VRAGGTQLNKSNAETRENFNKFPVAVRRVHDRMGRTGGQRKLDFIDLQLDE
jgi:hypothetical protein